MGSALFWRLNKGFQVDKVHEVEIWQMERNFDFNIVQYEATYPKYSCHNNHPEFARENTICWSWMFFFFHCGEQHIVPIIPRNGLYDGTVYSYLLSFFWTSSWRCLCEILSVDRLNQSSFTDIFIYLQKTLLKYLQLPFIVLPPLRLDVYSLGSTFQFHSFPFL